jgi:hypothetical protein
MMGLFDASMFGGPAGLWPYADDLPMRSDLPWLPQAAVPDPSLRDDSVPFWLSTPTAGPMMPALRTLVPPAADAPSTAPLQGRGGAPLALGSESLAILPTGGAPPAGPFDRLINGLGSNGNMLMGAGAALLSGQGFGGALKGAMTGMQADRQQGMSQRQLRALVQATLAPRAGWTTRSPRR